MSSVLNIKSQAGKWLYFSANYQTISLPDRKSGVFILNERLNLHSVKWSFQGKLSMFNIQIYKTDWNWGDFSLKAGYFQK